MVPLRDCSEGRVLFVGHQPSARAQLRAVLDAETVKPRLRGWLHLGSLPLAVVAGAALVALSPAGASRLASSAFALSGALLFGSSAAYHRGSWSPGALMVMRRLDHCGIFVLIAGTCTAYSLIFLHGSDRVALTAIVLAGATLGILTRLTWPHAPRWVSPPLYIILGLAPVVFTPALIDGAHALGSAGAGALVFAAAGGAMYLTGAAVYLMQRPDPWPESFGFHEVFHVFTILGFACHFAGIALVASSLR